MSNSTPNNNPYQAINPNNDENYGQALANYNDFNTNSMNNFNSISNALDNNYIAIDQSVITGIKGTANVPHINTGTYEKVDISQNIQYNPLINDISYNNLLKLRSELDGKLKELYYTNDSILSEDKYIFDTTIYTGVLWTILASSILYYIFTKI
jgi:hypothetical protein